MWQHSCFVGLSMVMAMCYCQLHNMSTGRLTYRGSMVLDLFPSILYHMMRTPQACTAGTGREVHINKCHPGPPHLEQPEGKAGEALAPSGLVQSKHVKAPAAFGILLGTCIASRSDV